MMSVTVVEAMLKAATPGKSPRIRVYPLNCTGLAGMTLPRSWQTYGIHGHREVPPCPTRVLGGYNQGAVQKQGLANPGGQL